MSANRALIRGLFLKFGFLSRKQIFTLLSSTLCRASIYENLKYLSEKGEIVPLNLSYQVGTPLIAHALQKLPPAPIYLGTRFSELKHRILCNETFFHLCRKSFVSGMTLEHEITQYKLETPFIGRRPDGVVQVMREDVGKFDMAVEVERTFKGPKRVNDILDCYQNAFEKNSEFPLALLIQAVHPIAFLEYQNELKRRSEIFAERVILSSQFDLADVHESKLGKTLLHPVENPWTPWTTFQIKSAGIGLYTPYFDLQYRYQDSGQLDNERFLEK